MKKFLALLEVEFRTVVPILLGIFGFLSALSMWLFYTLSEEMSFELIGQLSNDFTVADFVLASGGVTLVEIMNRNFSQFHYLVFMFSLFLLIGIISFGLWYKEWFGKSKRIYFLLSLRGERFTISLAKLVTIVASTWIFYGIILINLFIGAIIARTILPDGIMATNLIQGVLLSGNSMMAIVFPVSLSHFLYKTLFIVAIFNAISCWILMDRSKRIFGFIAGMAYCIALLAIFIRTQNMWLFYDERILVDWGFVLIANVMSLAINYFLINKKISI